MKGFVAAVVFCSALGVQPLRAAAAPRSPLWGDLEPGPYAVGYRVLDRLDYSRPYVISRDLDGKPRAGERARPMRISVWYPAEAGTGAPVRYGDYVALAAQVLPGRPEDPRDGDRVIFDGFPLLRDLPAEARERLKATPTAAARDAKPAPGKFPLILYSLMQPAVDHVTPEYLASHGYVVVSAPRAGAMAGFPGDSRDALDLDTKIRDTDFLLNAVQEVPGADLGTIGVVGFSAGGRWGLSEVMKNPDVRAMVSLDSVMLFDDPVGQAWTTFPFYDLESVRVPVLHMVRKQFADLDDQKRWDAMRYSERTYMLFPDEALDHLDFQSAGYAVTVAGGRREVAPKVAVAFGAFNRYTLAFFDAHLKGSAEAAAFLARAPEQNGLPAGFAVSRTAKAEPAPLTTAEFLNAVALKGLGPALAAFREQTSRRGRPALSEATVNTVGYTVLASGRAEDAVKIFELNVEAHPESANVYDSLADAQLAAGKTDAALESAEKALRLLDADTTLTPDRKELIRRSAAQKVERLKKRG
jgi:tetratricopeptide (TPR) repeat protein